MRSDRTIESLEPPSIRLHTFQIWVHGRQFPELQDYWDGNWLNVTAHCGGTGASVFATGAILHLRELQEWLERLVSLSQTLGGNADLKCIEPNVGIALQSDASGHLNVEVSLTPEHLSQRHWFQFELDQSYLGPLIGQLKSLLDDYPIRGTPDAS